MTERNSGGRAKVSAAGVGRAFRALYEEHLEERRHDDADATFRALESRMNAPASLVSRIFEWRKVSVFAGVAVPVLAVLLFFGSDLRTRGKEAELSYILEGGVSAALDPNVGALGDLLATEDAEGRLAFSDESRIALEPHTTLRVHLDRGKRVVSRLTQGSLRVAVEHRDATDYRFLAGEFEVKVVGTKFSLAYDPKTSRLELSMAEGRVEVKDDKGNVRVARAGDTLRLPEERKPEGEESEKSETSGSEELGREKNQLSAQGGPASASASSGGAQRGAGEYLRLAREGKFQSIVTLAEKEGFPTLLKKRSPTELHEIAQAFRYSGKVAKSRLLFEHLARTTPETEQGRQSIFFLARMDEDSGKLATASEAYARYLRVAPRGAYAEDALGRRLVLVEKTSGRGAALSIAREYLSRFPKGAYRQVASRVVGE